jgi:phenylacetaldehyde dehydrogenase
MTALAMPTREAATEDAFLSRRHGLLIGGAWVEAMDSGTIDVVDPATGRVIAAIAEGRAADIDRAVAMARAAFESPSWSAMPAAARRRLLLRVADLLDDNADQLARLESLDNGMPLTAAYRNVEGSAERFRYYAGWVDKIVGETLGQAPGQHAYTLKEPVGVVGQIVPWNFPLLMAAWKLAPALAAGCTVVLKPAETTSLTALRLGDLILEAGFPAGVVNIVTGYGATAGRRLAEHPGVDKIAFTGSTATGKAIVSAATANLKRVSLELGGKSPVIIFPDADLDRAIPGAASGIFSNAGQVCTAGSRLYVHDRVFDRVLDGLVEQAERLKVGPGLSAGVQMGPLVSQVQFDRVNDYLRAGRAEGAEIASGGGRVGSDGFFLQPTVLTQTSATMRVVREEIFGPVICVMRIGDDDLDAIASVANDTPYGLHAYVWTRDLSIAHRMARKLRSGMVSVNGGGGNPLPFGGVKQSGWGREHARDGIEMYFETKSVSITL